MSSASRENQPSPLLFHVPPSLPQLLQAVEKATRESSDIHKELDRYKELQGRMEEEHYALEGDHACLDSFFSSLWVVGPLSHVAFLRAQREKSTRTGC